MVLCYDLIWSLDELFMVPLGRGSSVQQLPMNGLGVHCRSCNGMLVCDWSLLVLDLEVYGSGHPENQTAPGP